MDSKDFKKQISDKLKQSRQTAQLDYMFKNRNSRPRAKENIINPKLKGI